MHTPLTRFRKHLLHLFLKAAEEVLFYSLVIYPNFPYFDIICDHSEEGLQ